MNSVWIYFSKSAYVYSAHVIKCQMISQFIICGQVFFTKTEKNMNNTFVAQGLEYSVNISMKKNHTKVLQKQCCLRNVTIARMLKLIYQKLPNKSPGVFLNGSALKVVVQSCSFLVWRRHNRGVVSYEFGSLGKECIIRYKVCITVYLKLCAWAPFHVHKEFHRGILLQNNVMWIIQYPNLRPWGNSTLQSVTESLAISSSLFPLGSLGMMPIKSVRAMFGSQWALEWLPLQNQNNGHYFCSVEVFFSFADLPLPNLLL